MQQKINKTKLCKLKHMMLRLKNNRAMSTDGNEFKCQYAEMLYLSIDSKDLGPNISKHKDKLTITKVVQKLFHANVAQSRKKI